MSTNKTSVQGKHSKKAVVFDAVTLGYLVGITCFYLVKPSGESMLNMSVVFSYVVGFLSLGVALSFIFFRLQIITLGQQIFEPSYLKVRRESRPFLKTFWGWEMFALFTSTILIGGRVTEFSFFEITDLDGFNGAKRIFAAMFTPEWSVLPRGVLAVVETIFIAFMATVFAVPLAFLGAFFAAKNIMSTNVVTQAIYFLMRTGINMTRSIEPLIWAIIFSVWVGIGPFAGMLALMLHSISSLTKLYSEVIESVNEGPIEGIRATGANVMQVIWYAIVPQITLPYISLTIDRWDINVRMATIIGLVGGGGIGTLLIQYQGQALWHEVGTLALLIVIVVWVMDLASAHLREALK